jgi:hypothetical protein
VRRRGTDRDEGNAVTEFVFGGLIMLVPLVYLMVGIAAVQRSQLAVVAAAREAGRAAATSTSAAAVTVRMHAAVRLALAAHGLPDDAELRVVGAGSPCTSPARTPAPQPGATFTVCVTRHVAVPGVPRLFAGRGVTCVATYTVHVDNLRERPP